MPQESLFEQSNTISQNIKHQVDQAQSSPEFHNAMLNQKAFEEVQVSATENQRKITYEPGPSQTAGDAIQQGKPKSWQTSQKSKKTLVGPTDNDIDLERIVYAENDSQLQRQTTLMIRNIPLKFNQ